MSTILDTLKKLEAEKGVLEKGVDLKNLMLEEELAAASGRRDWASKWVWLMLTAGATAVLVLGMVWNRAIGPSAGPAEASRVTAPVRQANPAPPAAGKPQTERLGITLDRVPGDLPDSAGAKKAGEEKVEFTVVDIDPIPRRETPPAPQAQPPAEPETHVNLAVQDTGKVVAVAPPPTPAKNSLIPGLQIKGIIFFGENNPANYLLVSNSKQASSKLKVGESLQGATLKEIHRQAAVFLYQGQNLRVSLGE